MDNGDLMSVTAAKARLLQVIRELDENEGEVTLVRSGEAAAFLLSPQRYYGLLETIEILADDRIVRSLRRSIRQASEDRWVDEHEVFADSK